MVRKIPNYLISTTFVIVLLLLSAWPLWQGYQSSCTYTPSFPISKSLTEEAPDTQSYQPPFSDPSSYWKAVLEARGLQAQESMSCWTFFAMTAAWFGVVLVFLTLLEALKTGQIASSAFSASNKSSERQLRAYITLIAGRIETVPQADGSIRIVVQIELKNSGVTPGYDFETTIDAILMSSNEVDPYPHPFPERKSTGRSIIGTQTSAHLSFVLPISQTELNDLRNGVKKVFVWGRADYMDCFGETRYLKFRSQSGDFAPGNNLAALSANVHGHEAN